MKNYKNFWKMTLGFGLLITLILPSAGLANAKTKGLPILLNSDAELEKYSRQVTAYLADCDDAGKKARSSSIELRKCLTIVKGLRDKFDIVLEKMELITAKIKKEKKWNKELDEEVNKVAADKLESGIVNNVKQAGGFRAFYQQGIDESRAAKRGFEIEIVAIEEQLQKNASTPNAVFQKISHDSTGENTIAAKAGIGRFLGKVGDVILVIYYMCVSWACN